MSDIISGAMSAMMPAINRVVEATVRRMTPWTSWATVAGTDPLAVTLDGADTPMAAVPSTLTSGLAVGDRVYLLSAAGRAVVIGRRGGQVDTGWVELTPEPGWTIAGAGGYRALSARRVGREVWIEGIASRGATIPAGFIATLPASIPPPPHRTPLLDHRPTLGQGEVTLGDSLGGNLNRVYNHTSRGTDQNVLLTGHYFID